MKHLFPILFLMFISLGNSQDKELTIQELDSVSETVYAPLLDKLPVYKGCEQETDNKTRKKCMVEKITQLVQERFNTSTNKAKDLPSGIHTITTIFKINTEGKIIDVKAFGPHPFLEKEAIRVIKTIPNMSPGMKDGKTVVVPYALPIKIDTESANDIPNTPDKNLAVYPIFRGCSEDFNYENSKKCTTKKVMDFIKLNFDYQMADRLFPLEQSTRFQLDFVINTKGKIEQVNAKANHKAIAIHAIKLAKRLPKFKKPGTVNGEQVNVPFSVIMTVYFQ